MMKKYPYKLLSYLWNKIAKAIAEELNYKISTIQKRAYGYRNKDHFKTAIYFYRGNMNF